jgi:Zn-finger nucleic acid-binding protein
MQTTAGLICPDCHGEMRGHERNRIVVDQCHECAASSWIAMSLSDCSTRKASRAAASAIATRARRDVGSDPSTAHSTSATSGHLSRICSATSRPWSFSREIR